MFLYTFNLISENIGLNLKTIVFEFHNPFTKSDLNKNVNFILRVQKVFNVN